MNSPLITLEHVSCTYHVKKSRLRFFSYEALKDISFELQKGEILGIVGNNGAGKSTLLRILSRILQPTTGTVHYATRVSISMLTLGTGFSDMLSGRDNAMLGGMLMGYTRDEVQEKLEGIIEFSELGDWINEPVRTYSTGMRARLGFAVAMETSPDVLLIDEVLGVGDGHFQLKSAAALKEKMTSGQTAVLVSHSPIAIKDLCSRVVWIEDGVVKMVGDVDEVMNIYTGGGKC